MRVKYELIQTVSCRGKPFGKGILTEKTGFSLNLLYRTLYKIQSNIDKGHAHGVWCEAITTSICKGKFEIREMI